MDENGNPYRPGAGTRPPALTGRDELLAAFRTIVSRALRGKPGQSMLPTGLRGVGKTVLLREFVAIAEAAGASAVAIEAPDDGSFVAALGQRLRAALLHFDRGPISRAVTRALRVLKSFSVTDPHGFRLALDVDPERGIADSGRLELDLADLLIAVGEAARDRRSGVVLVIDELQYLSERELGALVSAIHQTTQADLPVVLVGAGLPQLPRLAGEAKSYAERLFTFPRIGPLDRAAADAAVARPACDLGVRYESAALDLHFERTLGYPYFLQEYAYATWNAAVGPDTIVRADVERATPVVRQKLDENFFAVRVGLVTPHERRFLDAMARFGPGPYRIGEIVASLGASQKALSKARESLIGKGMIFAPALGRLEFSVPLFYDYLKRHPAALPTEASPDAIRETPPS